MKKIAFISDLHANLVGLDAALADIEARSIDEVICLGDIIDLGPQPVAVVNRLREQAIDCVRGNHDRLDENPRVPKLKAVEQWTGEQLDKDSRIWLADLPFQKDIECDGVNILCIHGSPRSNVEGIEPDIEDDLLRSILEGVKQDVVIAGHTHLPFQRTFDEKLFVNVGSVGMPFKSKLRGEPIILRFIDYAILTCESGCVTAELVRLPLDYDAFVASFKDTTFPAPSRWLTNWQK